MSALFPDDTNDENPVPCARARSRIAAPRLPLWERNPILPGSGRVGMTLALRLTSRDVFRTPEQLGPTRRMPERRQISISCRWCSTPSAPASPKPGEMTTRAWMPLAAQSSAASTASGGGLVITAASTSPGMSLTDVYAG